MHPLVVIAIGLGGVFVLWGAYEAADTLYEWYRDRQEEKEYEEYVRIHQEKGRQVPVFEQDSDEEEEEEDNQPLGIWKQKRDSLNSLNELRHRSVFSSQQQEMNESQQPPQYELYEMERSISEKRSLLVRETEILQQQEAELERRRTLLQSRGNSITGVFHDTDEENPFADSTSLSLIEQQQMINSSASPIEIIDQPSFLSSPFDDPKDNSASSSSPIPIEPQAQQDTLSTYQQAPQQAQLSPDLGGSWSDLEEMNTQHERTNSDESFHHV